jgi:lipid A 4'-phosphatase
MPSRALMIIVAVGVFAGAVFALDPSLDLRLAASFRVGNDFSRYPLLDIARETSPYLVGALLTLAALALLTRFAWPRATPVMRGRAAVFLLLTFALGPGILVNGILKPHWPRPRPGDVVELGGSLPFKPWWDPRGGCDGNCSFVSGEGSSAAWLAAPAVLLPPPWRTAALAASVAWLAIIGIGRMAAGGHFASDIVFAAVFTWLIVWAVHSALFRWRWRPRNETIEQPLERAGAATWRALAAAWRRIRPAAR